MQIFLKMKVYSYVFRNFAFLLLYILNMIIPFRPVTAADADVLRSFTMESKCMNCDMNVANLCSWQFLYHTEFAVVDGFLLLRFMLDGLVTYMKPIGKGDLRPILQLLMADARSLGDTFRMACVCPCSQALMDEAMPGAFVYTTNRASSDYLYLREKLVTLSGKKLQPKRNHISKFCRMYPDYEYRPLTEELVPECLRLGEEWCRANDCHGQRTLLAELHMMDYALHHRDELHIQGGALFVDGRIVAFTFGSCINATTFDVCVEKADTAYEGAYAMINREFVSRLPEEIIYINREEDLGIEGLRKAKLSYAPELILDKMTATFIAVSEETDDERRLRFETRHLWERSFPDPRAFIDLYFREKYRSDRNMVIVRDGRVVSALQKLPYPMTYGGSMLPVSYISGACTDEAYRCRGLMGELLERTHRTMYNEGTVFSFLIPASEELFGYYARFGYTPCFRFAWQTVGVGAMPEGIAVAVSVEPPLAYLRGAMQNRSMCIQHPLSDLRAVVDDMRLAGDTMWEARRGALVVGVAICRAEADGVLLRECVYDDEVVRDALIAGIASHYGRTELDMVDTSGTCGDCLGMARVINAEAMLTAYAALHPDLELTLVLSDEFFVPNNACFRISAGHLERLATSAPDAVPYTIASLTDLVLAQENPLMTLMMND